MARIWARDVINRRTGKLRFRKGEEVPPSYTVLQLRPLARLLEVPISGLVKDLEEVSKKPK